MTARAYDDLIAYLGERFGDEIQVVVRYTDDSWEFLLGEEPFMAYVANVDTRSPAKVRQDVISQFRHADVAGDLYGSDVSARLSVTEHGTGLNLFLGYEGLYLWFAPEVTLEVPDDVDACIERVDP